MTYPVNLSGGIRSFGRSSSYVPSSLVSTVPFSHASVSASGDAVADAHVAVKFNPMNLFRTLQDVELFIEGHPVVRLVVEPDDGSIPVAESSPDSHLVAVDLLGLRFELLGCGKCPVPNRAAISPTVNPCEKPANTSTVSVRWIVPDAFMTVSPKVKVPPWTNWGSFNIAIEVGRVDRNVLVANSGRDKEACPQLGFCLNEPGHGIEIQQRRRIQRIRRALRGLVLEVIGSPDDRVRANGCADRKPCAVFLGNDLRLRIARELGVGDFQVGVVQLAIEARTQQLVALVGEIERQVVGPRVLGLKFPLTAMALAPVSRSPPSASPANSLS